jgi:hypothetical protein
LRYYYSYCLKEVSEPDVSELDMLYLISFENPVKFRSPINLNSLIPLHLLEEDFTKIIHALLDVVTFVTPRDMASLDLSSNDRFHLISTLDYTEPPSGTFLEFGSYSGTSTRVIENYFQSHLGYENSTVYGFDSFLGLPENWRDGFPAGFFDKGPLMKPNILNGKLDYLT